MPTRLEWPSNTTTGSAIEVTRPFSGICQTWGVHKQDSRSSAAKQSSWRESYFDPGIGLNSNWGKDYIMTLSTIAYIVLTAKKCSYQRWPGGGSSDLRVHLVTMRELTLVKYSTSNKKDFSPSQLVNMDVIIKWYNKTNMNNTVILHVRPSNTSDQL